MKRKNKNVKDRNRKRRHMHIRRTVVGTSERPRVCVFRSNAHIYAQIVDDEQGRTLAAISSLKLDIQKPAEAAPDTAGKGENADKKDKKGKKKGGKKAKPAGVKTLQAREVGRLLAEAAKEKGINAIRFDRGGYLYHGRVAELAEAMRKNGLEF